ncbi:MULTISPECIES: hypothetical protein [unclassified Mesorhizobium]|uniref:hypothetical protein n=1 Tax=unclassified Mesorhizobium TaxID=325217 RepID=UPI0006FC02B2|nr:MULTISPECIES: hypothetical protein [unclassified Mesorhizobium]MDR7034547.1 hypothetical protein [Mesorhizobium sp. BE184]
MKKFAIAIAAIAALTGASSAWAATLGAPLLAGQENATVEPVSDSYTSQLATKSVRRDAWMGNQSGTVGQDQNSPFQHQD